MAFNPLTAPKKLLSRSLAQSIKDPAPSWLWTFTVIGVKDLPFLNPIYVTDLELGFKHIPPDEVLWGGQYVRLPAGPAPYQMMSMGLYEDHRYYSTSLLDLWMEQAVTKENYAGLPKNYCGTGYLMAFDTMGYPVMEITIKGMWPIAQSALRFGQQSAPVTKQATLSYNSIHMVTEEKVVNGLLDNVGLGDGIAKTLVNGVVGGGITMVPGL